MKKKSWLYTAAVAGVLFGISNVSVSADAGDKNFNYRYPYLIDLSGGGEYSSPNKSFDYNAYKEGEIDYANRIPATKGSALQIAYDICDTWYADANRNPNKIEIFRRGGAAEVAYSLDLANQAEQKFQSYPEHGSNETEISKSIQDLKTVLANPSTAQTWQAADTALNQAENVLEDAQAKGSREQVEEATFLVKKAAIMLDKVVMVPDHTQSDKVAHALDGLDPDEQQHESNTTVNQQTSAASVQNNAQKAENNSQSNNNSVTTDTTSSSSVKSDTNSGDATLSNAPDGYDYDGSQYNGGYRWYENGQLYTGFRYYMGTYYWFNNGVRQNAGWRSAWGYKYYTDDNGRAVQGNQFIDGQAYNFGDDGTFYSRALEGYVYDGSAYNGGYRWYENGQVYTGFRYYMGTYYWFVNGIRQNQGWRSAWGLTYWTDADGRAVQGWQSIDGQSYYFGDDGTYFMR